MLQALASVGCVLKWLESVRGGRLNKALLHILQSEPSDCVLTFIYPISLTSGLHKDGSGVVSPAPVLQALVWHGWAVNQQQQVRVCGN